MKRPIHSKDAPSPVGPYSQAIESGDLIFCAGQIALHPHGAKLVEGGIENETRQVLSNLSAVLAEAGSSLGDVVKATIFLTDLKDFTEVNRIYGEHFEAPYPARSTVQVAALPLNARVEIEVIARRRTH